MSAEKPTEWLVDLLYERDETMTDETEGSDNLSDGLDDAQRAELEATFAMLGEVRAAMPMEEPRASVRASILEAAHKQAEAQVAASASARTSGRRAPGSPRSSTESLWGGQNLYRAMSFAAVLCVLIGAGVIAQRMSQPAMEAKFSEANTSVTSEVSFADDSAAAPAAKQQLAALDLEEEAQTAEPTIAENDFPELAQNKQTPLDNPQEDPAVGNKTLAMGDSKQKEKLAESMDKGSGESWLENRSSSRSSSARSRAQAPKKELDSSSLKSLIGSDDSLDEDNYRADSRPKPSKKRSSSKSTYSYRGSGSGTDLDALAKNDESYDQNAQAPSRDTNRLFGGAEGDGTAQRAPATSSKDSMTGNAMLDDVEAPAEEPAPMPSSDAPADKGSYARTTESEEQESSRRFKIGDRLRRNRDERKASKADPAPRKTTSSSTSSGPAPSAPEVSATSPSREQDNKDMAIRPVEQSEKKEEAEARKPVANNTTIADVERARRSEDVRGTLEKADAFLDRGIGTQQEKARALELKAEALKELGRKSEADAVYRELEQKYPQYYKKENVKEKKKRSKRKAASPDLDFADEAMESF